MSTISNRRTKLPFWMFAAAFLLLLAEGVVLQQILLQRRMTEAAVAQLLSAMLMLVVLREELEVEKMLRQHPWWSAASLAGVLLVSLIGQQLGLVPKQNAVLLLPGICACVLAAYALRGREWGLTVTSVLLSVLYVVTTVFGNQEQWLLGLLLGFGFLLLLIHRRWFTMNRYIYAMVAMTVLGFHFLILGSAGILQGIVQPETGNTVQAMYGEAVQSLLLDGGLQRSLLALLNGKTVEEAFLLTRLQVQYGWAALALSLLPAALLLWSGWELLQERTGLSYYLSAAIYSVLAMEFAMYLLQNLGYVTDFIRIPLFWGSDICANLAAALFVGLLWLGLCGPEPCMPQWRGALLEPEPFSELYGFSCAEAHMQSMTLPEQAGEVLAEIREDCPDLAERYSPVLQSCGSCIRMELIGTVPAVIENIRQWKFPEASLFYAVIETGKTTCTASLEWLLKRKAAKKNSSIVLIRSSSFTEQPETSCTLTMFLVFSPKAE